MSGTDPMTHPLTPREKVVLKPCPFCGGEAFAGSNFDNDHYVMCGADCDKCGGMVGYMKTEMAAIENWNRRTALASGSGDHAELARLAKAATPGPWSAWIKSQTIQIDTRGGDGRLPAIINWPGFDGNDMSRRENGANARFIAAANPATVLALLAENAALRGSLTKANDGFEEYERKFYLEQDAREEAERKLAEAEARLERWEPKPFCQPSVSSGTSKEAERG